MTSKDDSRGQRRIDLSAELIESVLAEKPGVPDDVRLLYLSDLNMDRGTYTAIIESEEWDPQVEAARVPFHEHAMRERKMKEGLEDRIEGIPHGIPHYD